MSKQQIHIRVENSIYLLLKSKGVNISSLTNELLKSYLESEELETPEEAEIQKQIEQKTNLFKDIQKDLNLLSVMLAKVREENKIREKEEEEIMHEKHDLARQLFREQQMEQIRKEANRR